MHEYVLNFINIPEIYRDKLSRWPYEKNVCILYLNLYLIFNFLNFLENIQIIFTFTSKR